MNTKALRGAVAVVLFLVSCCHTSASAVSITLPSSVPSSTVIQDNFLGVSLEFNVLDFLIGPTPDNILTPMKNYLTNLRSRISNNLRLRVGGNSLDGSIYNPNATQMISFNLASAGGGVANVPVTYGPQFLTTLSQLGAEIGGISYLLGFSFAYPQNDSDVTLFARDAQTLLGPKVDTYLLGNEPDAYHWNGRRGVDYSLAQYSAEINKVVADLAAAAPGIELGFPTTCCDVPGWSLREAFNSTLNTPIAQRQKYVTVQHYPHTSCNISTKTSWNMSYFTNHTNVQQLVQWSEDGISVARAAGKPVIMTEFQTSSCGGEPGLSNTFGAALWTVDYVLGLAGNGYTAAYIHTREPGVLYNLFTYPNTPAPSNTGWQIGPQYYSLLFLYEAFSTNQTSSNGSVIVDLNLTDPTAAAGYAIYDLNSSLPRNLVFFNFGSSGARNFSLPSNLASSRDISVRVRTLTAPNLTENSPTQITYAGQTVNGTGSIQGLLSEKTYQCGKGCDIEVPGPGVSLLFLRAEGNSETSEGQKTRPSVSLVLTAGVSIGMLLAYVM